MSVGNQDNNLPINEDTTRAGTYIDTRGVTNDSNKESSTADGDVMRAGTYVDTRSVAGQVGNETVLSDDVSRDAT
jgi:hypothetical protein